MDCCARVKRRWTRSAVQPFNAAQAGASRHSDDSTFGQDAIESWRWRLPRTDVSGSIHFSKTRCFMSLVSLVLLVTDIPRTGLGVQSISEFFSESVAPDTAIRFGPYAYPVAHIACTTEASDSSGSLADCKGQNGGVSLTSVGAWPYGYDTTSVGIRSVAELFNVTSSFPEFLLNRGSDPRRGDQGASVSLEDTFVMLDSVIGASEQQIDSQRPAGVMKSVKFATTYNFIDRLHDYMLKHFSKRQRSRDYVLQVLPKQSRSPLEVPRICERTMGRLRSNRPAFCDHQVPWLVDNPVDNTEPPAAIWDHVAMRMRALQEQYQDLWMDVSLLSMQELIVMKSMTRATIYNLEAADLVVLVRGRTCSLGRADINAGGCTTVFVDDYRYERYLLTTNVADWYRVTAALRGAAQLYVWTRLLLLLYASCAVQPRRYTVRKKLLSAANMIVKIPFQVVVYGSSIPVVCYVLAHLIDGNFVDTYLENLLGKRWRRSA